jgi:hypothetical protein
MMNKIKPSRALLKTLNSIENLEDYIFVYETENSKILGPETSDCSFTEFVLLGNPIKDEYIYISTVKYGHIAEPEIHVKYSTKEDLLHKENYINSNGFENEWYKEGSSAVLDFEKFKYMQHLEDTLAPTKKAKQNKI